MDTAARARFVQDVAWALEVSCYCAAAWVGMRLVGQSVLGF